MSLFELLLSKFNYDDIRILENISEVNIEFNVDSVDIAWDEITNIISQYPSRDCLRLNVSLSTDDYSYILYKDGILSNYPLFKSKITEIQSLQDDGDKIDINIKINKEIIDNCVSIYSTDTFINWMTSLDINRIIGLFSELYNARNTLTFISYDKDIELFTNTFKFTKESIKANQEKVDREYILKSKYEIINLQGSSINVIPDDFNIIFYSYENEDLLILFNKVKTLLSLIHIADLSKLNDDNIEFQINGYRSSTFKLVFNEFKFTEINEYIYKIYKWIYLDGNKIDKAVIARNMISLHCRYHSILEIGKETFDSIKTNYSFYLKQNTDDYLDKKKEIYLSIINKCNELSDAIYRFTSDLKTNFIAYFTYLATLIVSNSFMNGRFKDIFTEEITLLTSIIIFGSLVYFYVSIVELNNKNKNIEDYIKDIKVGYGYMIDEMEIDNIINNSEVYKNSKENFSKNRLKISALWITFAVLLFLALDYLSGSNKLLFFFNFFE